MEAVYATLPKEADVAIQYYFNLATGQVEEGRRSHGKDLMGPYSTRSEAEQALATAQLRTQEWDEADAEKDMWGWDKPADEVDPPSDSDVCGGGSPS